MSDQNRKSHPRAAAAAAVAAGICVVLGFVQAPVFLLFAAWLGLVAVIFGVHGSPIADEIRSDEYVGPGAHSGASFARYGYYLTEKK